MLVGERDHKEVMENRNYQKFRKNSGYQNKELTQERV